MQHHLTPDHRQYVTKNASLRPLFYFEPMITALDVTTQVSL
jgi:hypothetical protein